MAVIASDNVNAAYDGLLSTANAWYRVEAHNLYMGINTTASLVLTTTRSIAVTFANAGNLMGVQLAFAATSNVFTLYNRDITVELVESGTTVRATTTLTANDIHGGLTKYVFGKWIVNFKFATPYAVDTVGRKWTIRVSQGAGNSNWNLATSDGTNPFYAAWCDTQMTASSGNDTLVIVDEIANDGNFTTKAVAVTGAATVGVGMTISAGVTRTPDTVSKFRWITTSTLYTFKNDGALIMGSHSGIQFGTSTTRTVFDFQLQQVPTVGTLNGIHCPFAKPTIRLYGTKPTSMWARLTSNAVTGQPDLVVDDASIFSNSDIVYILKENTSVARVSINAAAYTISSIAGNTITLTENIAGNNRLSGSHVVSANVVESFFRSDTATTVSCSFYWPDNVNMSGVNMVDVALIPQSQSSLFTDDPAFVSKYTFDYMYLSDSAIFSTTVIPSKGISYDNIVFFNTNYTGVTTIAQFIAGLDVLPLTDFSMTNIVFGGNSGTTGVALSAIGSIMKVYLNEVYIYHTGGGGLILTGQGVTGGNIYIWGCGSNTNTGLGGVGTPAATTSLVECDISNIYIDNSSLGYISSFGVASKTIIRNIHFGDTKANTTDIYVAPYGYSDVELQGVYGANTINLTYITYTVFGTKLTLSQINGGEENSNYFNYGSIIRTGDGLADTTVHTSGTDKYAWSAESTDGANNNRFEWSFPVPTGNIQNQDMQVGIWVRVAKEAYWGGTYYQMPRLTVNYDNGTLVYAEAAQIAADTVGVTDDGWQFLPMPFRPTTTYGQIIVTLSFLTDNATPANRYVHFDDIGILYPQGYTLNLGGLDLAANGLPVRPPIATLNSALDTWSVDPSVFGAGTVGKFVTKLLTVAKFLGLK